MKYLNLVLVLPLLLFGCKNQSNENNALQNKNVKEKVMKKVLFVVTSHSKLGDTNEKTGFWIEEFAAPYYELTDNGITIDVATPLGGQPPIDPKSEETDAVTADSKRYNNDKELLEKMKYTHKLASINQADYDAVFYPGGHGPLWDLAEDKNSIALIEAFYNNNKPVAFVCHSPGVLKNVKVNGDYLVKGKKVTGFSNSEEEAVGLTKIVPFLLEDRLSQNGGIYTKKENWQPYAVEDGLLITGQNPASSKLVAQKLLKQLK